MITGKDNSANGKLVKLLYDAHLAYAQGTRINEFTQYWADLVPNSAAFWETAILHSNDMD